MRLLAALATLLLGGLLHPLCACAADSVSLNLLGRSELRDLRVALEDDDVRWLRSKGILRIGTSEPDFPPFDITASDRDYEGVTADYLRLMAQALGVEAQVLRFPNRQAARDALRSGEIDLLGTSLRSDTEAAGLIQTRTYAQHLPVLVMRIDDSRPRDGKLAGLRLALFGEELSVERIRKLYPDAQVSQYGSVRSALQSVAFDQSDVFMGDAVTANYLIGQAYLVNLRMINFTGFDEAGFGFALAEGNQRLRRILDRAIESIPESEKAGIQRRWSGGAGMFLDDSRLKLTKREQRWIERNGPARLVVDGTFEPFTFFNGQGRFRGIVPDLLELIRQKTGLEFEVRNSSSVKDMLDSLRDGQANVSATLTATPERGAYLGFTRPYLSGSSVIVVRNAERRLLELGQLDGRTLAVPVGHFLTDYIRDKHPKVRVLEVENGIQALSSVADRKADAALHSMASASFLISRYYPGQLRIVDTVGRDPVRYSFAVSRSEPELQSILDKALLSISPDELGSIVNRWYTNAEVVDSTWGEYRAQLYQVGGVLLLVAVACAVWALYLRAQVRRREREERRLNDQLAFKRSLMDELQQAKEQAESASVAKSRFLATMSHEIRTPLNAITGMLELALKRERLDREAIIIARDSADSLLALIGDILDIAKIESGRMVLEPRRATPVTLTESVVRVFDGLARQKGLELSLSLDLECRDDVMVDPSCFKQILSNLISNAIKFTDRGKVCVSLRASRQGSGLLELTVLVEDSGIGIEDADLKRIFQPFVQFASGINAERGGTGLGLTICRRLVKLMDGRLDIWSEPGVGTRIAVSLCLPRLEPLPREVDVPVMSAVPSGALRVLVADDHPINRMMLTQQLDFLGYLAEQAENGAEALRVWEESDFDLVITDCNMPVMNGYELAGRIREWERERGARHCPIIGLTANAQTEELARCREAGMDDCLFKPIGLDGLQAYLQRLFLPSVPPGVPGGGELIRFDSNLLERATGGSPEVARMLLTELHRANEADAEALDVLRRDGRWEDLERLAHRIKGAVDLIDARPLVDHCVAFGEAYRRGASEVELGRLAERLWHSLGGLQRELSQYLQE